MDEQLPPAFFDVLTVSITKSESFHHCYNLFLQMGLTIAGILAVVTSVRPWSLLPILNPIIKFFALLIKRLLLSKAN